jgi:uncharacterized protein (DUF58 family)
MRNLFASIWRGFKRWLREPGVFYRLESSNQIITVEVQHWLPFLIFPFALIWYVAAPSSVALMTSVALGGLILGPFLWARKQARGVRGMRRLRFAAMQVGDELEELISLRNKTFLPVLWAEFVDRSNIPGYTVTSARAADPDSEVEWRAHTICTRRGVFNLGPWELRLGEPLGIFLVRQVYLQHQEILVYPPLALLPEHILPHRGALGDNRPLNQPLRAETIASNTIRAYAPGDPLRHIHWRTTARRIDPFVKVFAPEAASNVWLVPDFNTDDHKGEGDDASQEMMVTVVASLAASLLQQNLTVGLLASAGEETVVLPRQGQTHLWSILQALAPLNTAPDVPLEDVLSRAQTVISGSDLLIVVTPSLRPDWIGSLRRISRSRGSSGRAEVILLAPDSAEGETSAQAFLSILLESGVPANILRREDINLISGYYGEVSRWEFSVLGTGRAIARKTPRSAAPLLTGMQPVSWKSREN